MSNVVGLRGQPIPQERIPDPKIIEYLEWLLEAAKSGEIQGFASVHVNSDETTGITRAGIHNYGMVGRLQQLQRYTLRDLEG